MKNFFGSDYSLHVQKDSNLQNPKKFSLEHKVSFSCDCGKSWTSTRGLTVFEYRVKESDTEEGTAINLHFNADTYGQKCEDCEDYAEDIELYDDEIVRVARSFVKRILYKQGYIQKPKIDYEQAVDSKMNDKHREDLCAACEYGHH